MSYTPTEWESGDVVTSEKLNKMEQGISAAQGGGSDIFVVHFEVTWDDVTSSPVVTCDKTAEEIVSASEAGKLIVGKALMFQTPPEITMLNVNAYTYNEIQHVSFEYTNIWVNSEIGSPSSQDMLELGMIYYDGTGWYCRYSDYQLTPVT